MTARGRRSSLCLAARIAPAALAQTRRLAVRAAAASARGARRQVSRRTQSGRSPNGLQVIAVSHHEQPVVSLRLIVRAGSAQDPEDQPGVASLAATLLDQGTTTKIGRADRRRDRFDRRRARHRRGQPI